MKSTYRVLIVDDDPDDQYLIKIAFEQESEKFILDIASDGNEVLAMIQTPLFLPDLILLDLNMPFVSGFGVLQYLKQSPRHCHIPVIILTTSSQPDDVEQAYKFGANTFITKPASQQGLTELVRYLRGYWFDLATIYTAGN
ncbi:response regulator [Spirosoma jeollabukense]